MARSSYQRRIFRLLAVLLSVGIAIGLLITFWPKANLLLPRATPAADVSNWWQEDTVSTPYQWFSDHVLFSHSGWWRLQKPFTYDITTQTRTPLTELDKHLQDDGDMGTNSWEISPDHEWLLWTMELYDDVKVCRLDGSKYHTFPIAKSGESIFGIVWRAEGRHWIAESGLHSTGDRRRAFEGNREPPYTLRSLTEAEGEFLFNIPGIIVDRLAVSVWLPDSSTDVKKKTHLHEITLYPPEKGEVLDAVLDEQNHHIAWLLHVQRVPPWAEWLHRLLPRYALQPQHNLAIWVSRADGTQPREVGHLSIIPSSDSTETNSILRFLCWLPNGKKISFVYRNMLYTVPAD